MNLCSLLRGSAYRCLSVAWVDPEIIAFRPQERSSFFRDQLSFVLGVQKPGLRANPIPNRGTTPRTTAGRHKAGKKRARVHGSCLTEVATVFVEDVVLGHWPFLRVREISDKPTVSTQVAACIKLQINSTVSSSEMLKLPMNTASSLGVATSPYSKAAQGLLESVGNRHSRKAAPNLISALLLCRNRMQRQGMSKEAAKPVKRLQCHSGRKDSPVS